ncbi:MAG: diacylglycerol kinase family protein [bacterium]
MTTSTTSARVIPAFVNTESGSSGAAILALQAAGGFQVTSLPPATLTSAIQSAVKDGAPRILVAGGDGTIAMAASLLIGGTTELAILPGGTLNHFARDLGLTANVGQTLDLAVNGTARPIDVGMVNDTVFLNTSSVGMYVRFVRMREYLEHRHAGYRIASLLAAFRILFQFRRIAVTLEVDGEERVYRTPLVFIGVGERELKLPTLGNRVARGRKGLHVLVVRGRTGGRAVAIGLNAIARGVGTVSRTPELDSFIVDSCTIERRHHGLVAVDGELVSLDQALHYELRRGALRVVCP